MPIAHQGMHRNPKAMRLFVLVMPYVVNTVRNIVGCRQCHFKGNEKGLRI
jgi:hypothetical protein